MAMFDRKSGYLACVDPTSGNAAWMHPYSSHMREGYFRAISLGEYIYVFMHDQSVYRLEYGDAIAEWQRMTDIIEDHGCWPSLATTESSIYLSTGAELSPNKLVSRFDPSLNEWHKITKKINATCLSTLLVKDGFLYSFGGDSPSGVIDQVEFMDLQSMEWSDLPNMRVCRSDVSAVGYINKIYAVGGFNRVNLNVVEVYHQSINQWTTGKPLLFARSFANAFVIDDKVYVFGGGSEIGEDQVVEMHDPRKNDDWNIVTYFPNMAVWNSVFVKMSF